MAINTYCIIVTKEVIGKSGEGRTKGGHFEFSIILSSVVFFVSPDTMTLCLSRAELLSPQSGDKTVSSTNCSGVG